MRRTVLILCCLGILMSCNEVEKPEKPENLISKDKMVDILFDVFLFNAAKGTDRRILEQNKVTPDLYIYEKYKIDSLQFAKSNEYYAYDVKSYEDIISEVETRLISAKAKYEAEIKKEEDRRKRRLDSIKKLGENSKKDKTFDEVKQN